MSAGPDTPEIIDAKKAGWNSTAELASKWAVPGGVQTEADKHPNEVRASVSGKKPDTVTCMDGRVDKEGKVACAGCGLVLLADYKVDFRKINLSSGPDAAIQALPLAVADFIRSLKKAGIKNTESHGGCGAGEAYAEFYAREIGGTMSGDEAAEEWAKTLAKLLQGEYKGHVEVKPRFHNERAAYYSFSDTFNPKAASGTLLPGYVVSRSRFMGNPNGAIREMSVAASISLSESGYGKKFTPQTPFFFIVIARNEDEARNGKSELQALADSLGGRVRLQTLIIK
jgi:hypothetical protein